MKEHTKQERFWTNFGRSASKHGIEIGDKATHEWYAAVPKAKRFG